MSLRRVERRQQQGVIKDTVSAAKA